MKRLVAILALTLTLLPASALAEDVSIRFGTMPVLDTLPLQVAVSEGFFAEAGLDVELVSFNSALERDMALQAGHLDGYFGDLIAAVLLLQNGVDMPVAMTSYHTTPGQPMFGIATSPERKGAGLTALAGSRIGYSKATIMEFLLDMISAQHDLGPAFFERVEVKKVPIRMQMLIQSQLDAALLPEALLSLVRLKGGGLAVTAEDLDIPLTILALDRRFYDNGGEVYKRFVGAYSRAVSALAERPEQFRQLMAATCRIPGPLTAEFPIYRYPAPALPTASDVEMVTHWMKAKGMLKGSISHGEVVSPVAP